MSSKEHSSTNQEKHENGGADACQLGYPRPWLLSNQSSDHPVAGFKGIDEQHRVIAR